MPVDGLAGATVLEYFELPWDGSGNPGQRLTWAAVATTGAQRGTSLFAVATGELTPIAGVARPASTIGTLVEPLLPSPSLRFEAGAKLTLTMAGTTGDFANASLDALVQGANRLLIDGEILQFASAQPLGGGHWSLGGLLRGRGGTESEAQREHPPGARVVLLDDRLVPIPSLAGQPLPPGAIAAIGLGDPEPVTAALRYPLAGVTPLCPVHPSRSVAADGA